MNTPIAGFDTAHAKRKKPHLTRKAAQVLSIFAIAIGTADVSFGADLSTQDIFQKSKDVYASLSSYSDQGFTVSVIKGKTYTLPFRIKLARPNLYRIESQDYRNPPGKMDLFWSTGQGDFSDQGIGVKSRELNIVGYAGDIGRIPELFFYDDPNLTLLSHPSSYVKHQADEKVGGVDCYVFSEQKFGTTTLWIGKTDFLIHQIRVVATAEDGLALLAKVYKDQLSLPPPKGVPMGNRDDTETHTNIILNQNLTPADFK